MALFEKIEGGDMHKITALAFAVFLPILTYTSASAGHRDGLMAHYPFDGNTRDWSGHHHDGLPQGPAPTKDRFGNKIGAYEFNGLGDHIRVPHSRLFESLQFTLSQVAGTTTGEIRLLSMHQSWGSFASPINHSAENPKPHSFSALSMPG